MLADLRLLIAKLEAYGVGHPSLHLINSYLSNRIQRVEVNATFSSFWESLYGVPQGSILGPVLFSIYLSNLFNSLDEPSIVNYADDNTPFSIAQDINNVIKKLESNSIKLFQWLANNVVKANPENSHLLLSPKHNNLYELINNHEIANSDSEILLGMTFDNELNFNVHVSNLCNKATDKLHALARVTHYTRNDKKNV